MKTLPKVWGLHILILKILPTPSPPLPPKLCQSEALRSALMRHLPPLGCRNKLRDLDVEDERMRGARHDPPPPHKPLSPSFFSVLGLPYSHFVVGHLGEEWGSPVTGKLFGWFVRFGVGGRGRGGRGGAVAQGGAPGDAATAHAPSSAAAPAPVRGCGHGVGGRGRQRRGGLAGRAVSSLWIAKVKGQTVTTAVKNQAHFSQPNRRAGM